jgi:hypothetical protein
MNQERTYCKCCEHEVWPSQPEESIVTQLCMIERGLPSTLAKEIDTWNSRKQIQVVSEKKIRAKVYDEDLDEEIWDSDYIYINTLLCRECFKIGIHASLLKQKRLPYLRRDIGWFLSGHEYISEEEKKVAVKIYKIPSDGVYNCRFYRKEQPTIQEDNTKYITST